MRAALALGLLLLAGCPQLRYRSTANAPGVVHLAAPAPGENGDPARYHEPEDPGEHQLYVGPGVVLGPGGGRERPDHEDSNFELAVQVRLAYAELAPSHRRDSLPIPPPSWALTLGWAPLQTAHRTLPPAGGTKDLDAFGGPIYVEVERQWHYIASVGIGAAVYPGAWDGGVQATIALRPYGLRMRYLADGGFEILAAFHLELPTAITWSR